MVKESIRLSGRDMGNNKRALFILRVTKYGHTESVVKEKGFVRKWLSEIMGEAVPVCNPGGGGNLPTQVHGR